MDQDIINTLAQEDPILGKVMAMVPFPDVESTGSVFHDLMSCILEQQIHYRSTKKIFQKLLNKADLELLTPENFEVLEDRAFSNLKLSANKYQTLLSVLELFKSQDFDWAAMEDAAVRKELTAIKGISNWTADMILLHTLDRPNIFPIDDYHLKQIIPKLYPINPGNSMKKELKAIAENWHPYQSVAVKYLWAWKQYKP